MKGDVEVIVHLVGSMDKALESLVKAKQRSNTKEFNESKALVLDLQRRISEELRK